VSTQSDVAEWLREREEPMAELLLQLIAIDTENPPGRGLEDCAAVLADAMSALDLAPEVVEVEDAEDGRTGSIVIGRCGEGPGIVYFHGHFDVVPAQSRDQFKPRREDGRIIGRGAADMKGGLVSMIYAAAAARDLGLLDGTQIVLHCVCDEETGSTLGSGNLRARNLIDPDAIAMLTAEPTGGVVWHAARGAITAKVTVAGREAHVGPVPGSAWFSVDWRFNPEQTLESELARLHSRIDRAAEAAGAVVDVELLQQQPAGLTSEDDPQAQRLAACVEAVRGSAPAFQLCPGVLDTRWYAQLGVPAFAYGGGRLDISHGPNEYIDEQAMRDCAAVYALFAARLGE
jgi:acetylornithine deacetylase/succinyl-diaminopimelate desuccinylase-like protein